LKRRADQAKNDKKISDKKITGPVNQAIEKSEDRKIRGRKMKRDSTTKPTKQTKAEDAKNRVSH